MLNATGMTMMLKALGFDPSMIEGKVVEAKKVIESYIEHIDNKFALLNLRLDRIEELIVEKSPAGAHDISALLEQEHTYITIGKNSDGK